MSEYIEREAVSNIIKTAGFWESEEDREVALICIEQAPVADVAPVRHAAKAESADSKTGLICTACYLDIDADAVYCKYCGALLDGKEGAQ